MGKVTFHYCTGWRHAFIHYSSDGGQNWTQAPGEQLTQSKVPKWHQIVLDSSNLEFVMNNGQGCWDHPSNASTKNYVIKDPGTYVLKSGKLTYVSKGLKKVLIVTDLDGTLIGDDEATKNFYELFERELHPLDSFLVYNSGRALSSFMTLYREKNMITPTAFIGSVGTEIHWFTGIKQEPIRDTGWEAQLKADGWDRRVVEQAAKEVIDQGKAHWRPKGEMNDYKLVLGVKAVDVDHVISSLKRNGVQGAEFISSGHGEWRYLDVISSHGGKLKATLYVMNKLGFDEQSTVACGDSGNDILMLDGEILALVMGNAQKELLQWYEQLPPTEKENRVFFAKDKACANGIIEGLYHFQFISR